MVFLYAVTIFTSAALLFLVQPMFARLVLPVLGGAPAVWNTAMVFFQFVLLAGYALAHLSATRLGARRQVVLQLAVLLGPLAVLPIAVPAGWIPPTQENPTPWLLAVLAAAVGLPFLAVATTSPLLQRWFAASGHPAARDPYFLSVAGNAGSLLALVGYPAWIERAWPLAQQARLWTVAYLGLLVLTAICAGCRWRHPDQPATVASAGPGGIPCDPGPSAGRRARWVLLAFVPSSLMLGVTSYLSSEIAAVPLLWVIPLGLYLLTFVVAFARRELISRRFLVRALPVLVVPLVVALNLQATSPIGWLMLLHLGGFFVAALLCHGRLAADRPAPVHLTEFYLWLSVGGVLGGAFNALLAPLIFNSVAEYPLVVALACAVALREPGEATGSWRADLAAAVALGAVAVALVLGVQATRFRADAAVSGLVFGLPALGAFLLSRRPRRFALAIAALLLAGGFHEGEKGRVLRAERTFFGLHRVTLDPSRPFHLLVHGMTLHGQQSLDPARRSEALAYYHRSGPIGQVLHNYAREPARRVGAVGLGVGALAAHALPGQAWTYFEIDPAVVQLARDERYFTFLRDSPAALRVVLGDARRSLGAEADAAFDVLVIDAYSSDAIPVHLVTREALALYLRKLAAGGVLAFHISNLHLDLEPVFANLARDAGLVALTRDYTVVAEEERTLGKAGSVWLVMGRRQEDLAALTRDSRWQPSRAAANQAVWTDDYSSLLSVFRWR